MDRTSLDEGLSLHTLFLDYKAMNNEAAQRIRISLAILNKCIVQAVCSIV